VQRLSQGVSNLAQILLKVGTHNGLSVPITIKTVPVVVPEAYGGEILRWRYQRPTEARLEIKINQHLPTNCFYLHATCLLLPVHLDC
jgi:hypothetical protein